MISLPAVSVNPPKIRKRTVKFVTPSIPASPQTALDVAMAEDMFSGEEADAPESDDDDFITYDSTNENNDDAIHPVNPPPKRVKSSPANGMAPITTPTAILSNERAQFRRIVDAMSDPDKEVGRGFKATSTQALVFENITNGKCASGVSIVSPQHWVEGLQSLEFGLVWYPSFCCGIYSFEFSRTISIASFAYED